jgi:uncharacterized membrane protein YeaQ/YmgE (transglycosylase-associated protein family)
MVTGFIGWIALGLLAAIIASRLANKRGDGLSMDILLGVVGAVVCGWLFNAASAGGVTRFSGWSLVVAVVGAVVLVGLHSFRRSSRHV